MGFLSDTFWKGGSDSLVNSVFFSENVLTNRCEPALLAGTNVAVNGPSEEEFMVVFRKIWRCGMVSGLLMLGWMGVASLEMGCSGDPCQRYFNEVKSRCQLGSSAEGAKLDQYLQRQFKACQVEICNRTSINSINCLDPNTHIPGGINGRFNTCED